MIFSTFQVSSISLIVIIASYVFHFLQRRSNIITMTSSQRSTPILPNTTKQLKETLLRVVPHCLILDDTDQSAFKDTMNHHWAQQEREAIPACVAKPRTVGDLSQVVSIIQKHYKDWFQAGGKDGHDKSLGSLFAVRSGGHSPITGAASASGGVLIDMGFFDEVTPIEDGSDTVVIGSGAKWGNVSLILEKKGIAVSGGRDADVGVGGFLLGGGLSYFSGRFGLSCSNINNYEIVLADGTITNASATQNPELWRALKGGSNNFGIVTRFTVRRFPSTDIWAGFLFMPSSQSQKVLVEFHQFLNRRSVNPQDHSSEAAKSMGHASDRYDQYAAGPLACFGYLNSVGMKIISVHLAYTKAPEKGKKWPLCWETTKFKSMWRLWSTTKLRSLTSTTEELKGYNGPGFRQTYATTTIRNDLATINAAHHIYLDTIKEIRRLNIKGMKLTLVFQPLLPAWVHKGDPNPQGLQDLRETEALVIVSVGALWLLASDDADAQRIVKDMTIRIEEDAKSRSMSHPWKYLNYSGGWQKPLESYGQDNLKFLRDVSQKYDPEGLFQYGCTGGFKLWTRDDHVQESRNLVEDEI